MRRLFFYVEKRFWQVLRIFIGRERRDTIRNRRNIKKRAKIVKEKGSELLSVFSRIILEEGCGYWLFWGTLLGAYREKGFIKHDDDIDIGMYDTDISIRLVNKMIDSGFKVMHCVVDKDFVGGFQLAFMYKDIKFDIYSFHKDERSGMNTVFCPIPYNYAKWGYAERTDIFDILHVHMPAWKSLIEVPFENIVVTIPSNADDILRILYGDNYMTPIAGVKAEQQLTDMKVHENPKLHYACTMSYEVFKMFKHSRLI